MRSYAALAAFSLATVAYAFENIAIQETVQAGTDTQGTIANDIAKGSGSFDADFAYYRIYLATTPPGSGTMPACILVNNSAIGTTTFTVNIPADVGPEGEYYSLATMEYNTDPNKDGPSGFQYSNSIDLEGATGNWSQLELGGTMSLDPDNIPCTAYGCARSCAQQFYPNNTGEDITDWIPTQECINACPGVVPIAYSLSNGTSTVSTAESTITATASVSTSASGSTTQGASSTPSGSRPTGSATGSAAAATSTGAASTLNTSIGGVLYTVNAVLLVYAWLCRN